MIKSIESGSLDGSRPGAFYAANTGVEPFYTMPTLAYHEGVPGHHMQITIGQEQDLPDFRRFTRFTAFVEGWALYAERLAVELNWYENDPYGRLGQLRFEAMRAARLVVDTGIHFYGWSFDEASTYYHEATGFSMGSSQGAAARFMLYPGQATAYMIGMKKFQELRDLYSTRKGAMYDIKAFHDLILGGGSLPLPVLEQLVTLELSGT